MSSKVLLPSDGSDTSLKAAAYALRLMKINPEIELTVLVVVPDTSGIGNIKEKELLTKFDNAMVEKGEEILKNTMKLFQMENIEVNGVIEKGDPAGMIIDYSRRGKFDHIIIGSRGVSELRGMALGSVSHKVIHLANCRVTLVK